LTRIDREVARIDRTVRELLDFSRPGAQPGALVPVPLKEAVDQAVRLASVQKRLKGVEFNLEVDEGLKVLAEPHHLSQVLVNVLLNAGDAMKGEGRVHIRAGRVEPAPGRRASDPPPVPRIELSLGDSGPGIAQADLSRVFDPFFTTKEPGEGTGLGLSICHSIMEAFGGDIRAGNRPEGGALITLSFREAAPA
jgi:signal transduction histidine kinase